jgi:hypothetical protein
MGLGGELGAAGDIGSNTSGGMTGTPVGGADGAAGAPSIPAGDCMDEVWNGDETDVDCGGSCAAKCGDSQGCGVAEDCEGSVCTDGICGPCVASNGGTEACDGRDNDCDSSVDNGASCPSQCSGRGWGGHGYVLCNASSTNTYQTAQTVCQAEGMHLAWPDTPGENVFLTDWAFGGTKSSPLWIGGDDVDAEGDWLRYDGVEFWSGDASGTAVDGAFAGWSSGQPDNKGVKDEGDCLSLLATGWDDQRCAQFLRLICETY